MSDKPDIAADLVRSIFEGLVIETPEGPMVLREVKNEPVLKINVWLIPDEPVIGTLSFGMPDLEE